LKKEDPAKFKRQFSKWEQCLTKNKTKTCEDLYKKVQKEIIAKPQRVKKTGSKKPSRTVVTKGYARVFKNSKGSKWLRHFRQSGADRKAKVNQKMAAAFAAAQERANDD
jgi:hypothetical protein